MAAHDEASLVGGLPPPPLRIEPMPWSATSAGVMLPLSTCVI